MVRLGSRDDWLIYVFWVASILLGIAPSICAEKLHPTCFHRPRYKSLGARKHFRRVWRVCLRTSVCECVQYKLDSVRDADLVVDAEQRFLDRVFLDPELLRNLAVPDPFRDQADDLVFSRGQQALSLRIDDARGRRQSKGFY